MSGKGGLFIAGTDTGIGKTHTAVAIVRALCRRGLQVAVMKPVAAGAVDTPAGLRNEDALALIHAANVAADYSLVNPYCLRAPVSPHLAAAEEGVTLDRSRVARAFETLAQHADCVVVEGAGGWLAPIGECETMADVARTLALPIVLVVGLKLGCLSHAQLSARAIEADGLHLAGWIANQVDPRFERMAENVATLERLLGRAPLALLHHARVPGHLIGAAHEASPSCALPDSTADALVEILRAAPRTGRAQA